MSLKVARCQMVPFSLSRIAFSSSSSFFFFGTRAELQTAARAQGARNLWLSRQPCACKELKRWALAASLVDCCRYETMHARLLPGLGRISLQACERLLGHGPVIQTAVVGQDSGQCNRIANRLSACSVIIVFFKYRDRDSAFSQTKPKISVSLSVNIYPPQTPTLSTVYQYEPSGLTIWNSPVYHMRALIDVSLNTFRLKIKTYILSPFIELLASRSFVLRAGLPANSQQPGPTPWRRRSPSFHIPHRENQRFSEMYDIAASPAQNK